MASPPRSRKRTYHHGDLRRALVRSAVTVIRLKGLEGLSLREVARRAGVSHAAPYHHFGSRDELVEAVAEQGFEELRGHVLAHLRAGPDDPSILLREAAVGYVLFAVENPDTYRIMFGAALTGHTPSPGLRAASAAAYDVIFEGIARSAAGRPVDRARVETMARACWSLVHGVASLAIDGQLGPMDASRAADETRALSTVLWRGLQAILTREPPV